MASLGAQTSEVVSGAVAAVWVARGNDLTRRRVLRVLVVGAAAGAVALAACQPGASGAVDVQVKPTGKDVTITHVFNWAPAQFAPMEKNTNRFMAANPTIKVVSTPATGGAWPDKPLSMYAAGTPPDVMSGDVSLFRWKLAE